MIREERLGGKVGVADGRCRLRKLDVAPAEACAPPRRIPGRVRGASRQVRNARDSPPTMPTDHVRDLPFLSPSRPADRLSSQSLSINRRRMKNFQDASLVPRGGSLFHLAFQIVNRYERNISPLSISKPTIERILARYADRYETTVNFTPIVIGIHEFGLTRSISVPTN